MAGSLSDYAENAILDHLLMRTTFTQPTNLYVGLSTSTIADASTGGACGETTGTNYSRKQCDTWTTAVAGVLENVAAITFDVASGSWGTITDFFIADATADGNILFYTTADASKVVGTGDTVQFDAETATISLD